MESKEIVNIAQINAAIIMIKIDIDHRIQLEIKYI